MVEVEAVMGGSKVLRMIVVNIREHGGVDKQKKCCDSIAKRRVMKHWLHGQQY